MHLKILRIFGDILDFREKVFFSNLVKNCGFFIKKNNISKNTQKFEMHAIDTFFGKILGNNIASYHHSDPSRPSMRIQGLKHLYRF